MTTTDQSVQAIATLASSILGSARRFMMNYESEETFSAQRAVELVRREFYVDTPSRNLATDEALRLVQKLSKAGGLGSLEVLIAAEAIMTERSR